MGSDIEVTSRLKFRNCRKAAYRLSTGVARACC